VIKLISKKFKLSKVLDYVEKPNELDKRVELLEKMAHPPKEVKCCCNKKPKGDKK
jgi:hypothetical protein